MGQKLILFSKLKKIKQNLDCLSKVILHLKYSIYVAYMQQKHNPHDVTSTDSSAPD